MDNVLLNEIFVTRETAKIDIEDRGYQFGDGVYEVIPVYKGRLFRLDAHLDRLKRSAEEMRLQNRESGRASFSLRDFLMCK